MTAATAGDGMVRTALVLGATGGIGGAVTQGLLARGWRVRALHRRAETPAGAGVVWLRGDAMSARDVRAAAAGVELIVHAVNPPGYKRWAEVVLPMLDNSIAAAVEQRARILLPGTVYNYATEAQHGFDPTAIREDAPQNPSTRKGRIRVELEARLQTASTRGARVLIVRTGDFFGAHAGNNWFAEALVRPGRPVRFALHPGTAGVGHQWAYLPDVAETMLRLLDRESELEAFARFHMDGHWDDDGTAMLAALARVLGVNRLPLVRLPWPLVQALSPLVQQCREMSEMRALWRVPSRLRNDELVRFLGEEPHTSWDDAVRSTLQFLGCLPAGMRLEAPAPAAALVK